MFVGVSFTLTLATLVEMPKLDSSTLTTNAEKNRKPKPARISRLETMCFTGRHEWGITGIAV